MTERTETTERGLRLPDTLFLSVLSVISVLSVS
jgi:hypothetical protein